MQMFMLLVVLQTITQIRAAETGIIVQPNSVDLITKDVQIRDKEHLFDNNPDTQTLIYGEENQPASILISMPYEYQIDNVEIVSDEPSDLKQSIRVGYVSNGHATSSETYECIVHKTSTTCQPSCKTKYPTREGVVGLTILWTIERTAQRGWTRIYDVIVRGRLAEEVALSYGRNGDLAFLKPYTFESGESESCEDPIWKLTDASAVDSSMAPVTKRHRSVTVHFGRTCVVNRVALMLSSTESAMDETVLHFGGPQPFSKTIRPAADCVAQSSATTTHGMLVCETKDLAGYPFNNVTVDVQGYLRFHIYGVPFLYPRIGIVPSAKNTDAESMHRLELKCAALSCNSNSAVHLEAMVHGRPIDRCSAQGWAVKCAKMELLRVHQLPTTGEHTSLQDAVLVSDGHIVPEVKQIMTELELLEASPEQLVVSMPRTHPYYGQYKCRCQTNDQLGSAIESLQTALSPTEFDRDLVFQRNYSAIFNDDLIQSHLGFLELPDDPQTGFFRLVVAAHSLTEKLDLNATFIESGRHASMTGEYAHTTSVAAFPRAQNALYAWPIPAYRVELQDAWPDVVDAEEITIEWSTTEEAVNVKTIKDSLRTLVISPARNGEVRGWIWERNAHRLDIRAHAQLGEQESKKVEIALRRSGCSSNGESERVGSVSIHDAQCVPGDGPVIPVCEKTQAGFAVQFVIIQPSALDTYDLSAKVDADSTDKQLVHSAAVVPNLKAELDTAEITLKIVAIGPTDQAESTPMDMTVVVHSKAIVDNSACRPMHLSLHPTWSVSEPLEQMLKRNETVFRLAVPNDQRMITLDMELRIEAAGAENPEVSIRRSLTLPNPRFYIPDISQDSTTGTIEWSPLPVPFRGLLDHFQVKLFRTDRVCGLREEVQAPAVRETYNGALRYKVRLADLPDFDKDVQVKYEVEIRPILRSANNAEKIEGAVAIAEVSKGKIGQSLIKQHVPLTSRSARFYIVPSQLSTCLRGNQAMTVSFDLQVIGEDPVVAPEYLKDVGYEADDIQATTEIGKWYRVTNLQPGRRYEIKAVVHYPTGEEDQPSPIVVFWTPDEVHITSSEAFVSPGNRVVFNCTGAVGPENRYRKRLEWKRADGTPLPEGSRVELVSPSTSGPEWQETVSLIFDPVESGQANSYACFIRPSILEILGKPFVPPSVKLGVTELQLDQQSYTAEFGASVTVTCTSKQAEGLQWIAPDGHPLMSAESGEQPFSKPSASGSSSLELHIPRASLEHTGKYVCANENAPNNRTFNLRLKEDIQLRPGGGSSFRAAEKLLLNCTARLGAANQQIVWYKRGPAATAPWVPLTSLAERIPSMHQRTETGPENIRYSIFTWVNSPSSNGQFACVLEETHPGVPESELVRTTVQLPEHSATYATTVQPTVEVTTVSNVATGATLKCSGHPGAESDRLGWLFLAEGDAEENAIPVEPADAQLIREEHKELTELIQRTFRLGDYTPATWPGAAGPVLLAASGKLPSRLAESVFSTPESLEVIVSKPLDPKIRSGSLLCQYRSSAALVYMQDDASLVLSAHQRSTEPDSQYARQKVLLSDIEDSSQAPSIESASGKSMAEKNEKTDDSIPIYQCRSSLALWCLSVYVLIRHV